LNTKVSQGSVVMRLRCDVMSFCYAITAESDGEKIGQHLPKLWAIKFGDIL